MIFPDYIIQTPPKHPFQGKNSPDYIILTVSAQVLNMFVTWIIILGNNTNLPSSHPFVLGHCYLFLVKNRIFGLLDQIAPKLQQKIIKNSRIVTPLKGTSWGIPPLKIQNFIV